MPAINARPAVAVGSLLAAAVAVAAVPPVTPTADPPVLVRIDGVELTGFGLDLYNAVTPVVQYAVGGVSYLVNFVPVVGALTASQININYFQGVQPTVAATVHYLADVVADPASLVGATQAYAGELNRIGAHWVAAQLRFLGLPAPARTAGATVAAAAATAAPGRDRSSAARPGPVQPVPRPAASRAATARTAVAARPARPEARTAARAPRPVASVIADRRD